MNAPNQNEALEALAYFFRQATCHDHGGARVAARLLLGLYDGERFLFDLTDLRLLDGKNLERALALLRFDAHPAMEVHRWLDRIYGRNDFGMRFEHMAHAWRLKGRCEKKWLTPVPAIDWSTEDAIA